jgi:hypothetical protein
MDILNTRISYIPHYSKPPNVCTLKQALEAIRNPVNNKPLIKEIRDAEALIQSHLMEGDTEGAKKIKDTYKAPLKGKLPAFIFGAICEGGHNQSNIIEKTGIVCIDFDSDLSTTPAQWEAFRDNLINVKYVFYSALSVSASGVMALLKIADPDKQKDYFEQMKVDFAGLLNDFEIEGAKLDISKGSNPAQLRFLTYDPEAKYKQDFSIYDRLPREKPKQRKRPDRNLSGQSYESVFELAVNMTRRKGFNFQPRSMHHSILFLSNYLNSFGVPQNEAEQWIYSNILPESEIHSNCISDPYQRYSHEFGRWEFKPRTATRKRQPDPNPYPHGVNPYTGEIFDERGYPSDWDTIEPPDERTTEYNEMLQLIQRELGAEIDYSFNPDETQPEPLSVDTWRKRTG